MTTLTDSKDQATLQAERANANMRSRRIAFDALRYTLAVIVAIIMIFPFFWMVSTSFKSVQETRVYPPTIIPDNPVGLENYQAVLDRISFFSYLKNSTVVAGVITVGALFTSSLAGYIFAKFRFRGRSTA